LGDLKARIYFNYKRKFEEFSSIGLYRRRAILAVNKGILL
jgi:hypothetical protein